jgi:hypothetical protein
MTHGSNSTIFAVPTSVGGVQVVIIIGTPRG